jgi:hypothetical protein
MNGCSRCPCLQSCSFILTCKASIHLCSRSLARMIDCVVVDVPAYNLAEQSIIVCESLVWFPLRQLPSSRLPGQKPIASLIRHPGF